MLRKKCLILCLMILPAMTGISQTPRADSIPSPDLDGLAMDTSMNYDELMDDLSQFLDSLLAPRSYFLVAASASGGYFNYPVNNSSTQPGVEARKKFILSPTLGYYHKSGPGLTVSGNANKQEQGFVFYQYLVSPSFDFIQSRKWVGGVSYTRYFNRDSVEFYLTPLQNELNAYFLWRKAWLQPGISVAYGWGSREAVKREERLITLLRGKKKRRQVITIIDQTNTEESIADFSLNASLRHSFYWLDLSKRNDYIRFTPMLVFSSGTQKFGFNQSSTSYANTVLRSGRILPNKNNVNLDNKSDFQPLSLTLYLRPEYSIGKFYIQPQLLLDYYFPGADNNFTVVPSINAGFMF